MSEVLSVDVLIANEEDCGDVLGIHGKDSDVLENSMSAIIQKLQNR